MIGSKAKKLKLGKFKTRLQINVMSKQPTKNEPSKDYINFTPKSQDIERDTSLEGRRFSKISAKKNGKFGERKQYLGVFGSKQGKLKNISMQRGKGRVGGFAD